MTKKQSKPFGESFHSTRPDEFKYVRCAQKGCEAKFDNHRHGAIDAQNAGWFRQKDETAWCPEHNPPWVAEWRARKARKV